MALILFVKYGFETHAIFFRWRVNNGENIFLFLFS